MDDVAGFVDGDPRARRSRLRATRAGREAARHSWDAPADTLLDAIDLDGQRESTSRDPARDRREPHRARSMQAGRISDRPTEVEARRQRRARDLAGRAVRRRLEVRQLTDVPDRRVGDVQRTADPRQRRLPRTSGVRRSRRPESRIEMDQHTFGLEPFEWRRWIKRHLEDVSQQHADAAAADLAAAYAARRPDSSSTRLELWRIPALTDDFERGRFDPARSSCDRRDARLPGAVGAAGTRRLGDVEPVLVRPRSRPRASACCGSGCSASRSSTCCCARRCRSRSPTRRACSGEPVGATWLLDQIGVGPPNGWQIGTVQVVLVARRIAGGDRLPLPLHRAGGRRAVPLLAVPRAVVGRDEARPGHADPGARCSCASCAPNSGARSTPGGLGDAVAAA